MARAAPSPPSLSTLPSRTFLSPPPGTRGDAGGLFAPRPRPIPGRGSASASVSFAPAAPSSTAPASASAARSFDRHTPRSSGWGGRGGPKKGGAGGRFTWGAAGDELADEAAWAGLKVGSAPRSGWHPNTQAPSGPLAAAAVGGGEGGGGGGGAAGAGLLLGRRRSLDRGGGGGPAPLSAQLSWGRPAATPDPAIALDRGDPNWDSDADAEACGRVALSPDLEGRIAQYKRAVASLLAEFFDAGDVGAASEGLAALGAPGFDAFFVKRAVTAALDRGAREREGVSRLLAALSFCGGRLGTAGPPPPRRPLLRPAALAAGFRDLAACTDDLALDVPGAHALVATFTARAVADDALAPAFLDTLPPSGGGGAGAVRAAASDALAAPHAAERLARCWGAAVAADATEAGIGGGGGSEGEEAGAAPASPPSPSPSSPSPPTLVVGRWAATHTAVAALVAEYLASGDVAEAGACLRALAIPFAHHEAVRAAVVSALEAGPPPPPPPPPPSPPQQHDTPAAPPPPPPPPLATTTPTAAAVARLLSSWAGTRLVSASQMAAGFERVGAGLDDTALDAPGAVPSFGALVAAGVAGGWLDPEAGSPAGRAAGLIPNTSPATGAAAAAGGGAPPPPPPVTPAAAPPFGGGAGADADVAALTAAAVAGLEAEAAAAGHASPSPRHHPSSSSILASSLAAAYKASAVAAISEFFESGDVDAADAALRAAAAAAGGGGGGCGGGHPHPHPHPHHPHPAPALLGALAVKASVRLSLDRRAREREATARLLASLVARGCLPRAAIAAGFARLLGGAADLALDAPGAPAALALFLARAVADGLLPPAFLASIVPALPPGSLGVAVVEAAGAHLAARGGVARVRGAWTAGGGGAGRGAGGGTGGGDAAVVAAAAPTASGLRSALRSLLDAFYAPGGGDCARARACLRDLAAPFYHHELVRAALSDAVVEDGDSAWAGAAAAAAGSPPPPFSSLPPTAAAALALLASLTASGDVSSTQAAAGVSRFEGGLEALSVECGPAVRARAGAVLAAGRAGGALPVDEEE